MRITTCLSTDASLLSTCVVGPGFQVGGIVVETLEGIGIQELATPQQGARCRSEPGLITNSVPALDDLIQQTCEDRDCLLAGQQKMSRGIEA